MKSVFESARTQKRIKDSFEQTIREYWPLELILEARAAIESKNYQALDVVLSKLDNLK